MSKINNSGPKAKMKTGPLVFLVVLALVGAFFGIQALKDNGTLGDMASGIEQKSENKTKAKKARARKGVKTVKIAVCTWGGYVGGQYFNNGFDANEGSRFSTEYGFDVEFVLEDDPAKSLAMFENDEVQLHWYTADAFSTILAELSSSDPQIVFQADWSRGGDAIVTGAAITSVADLKGKTVAVAPNTASHSFLIKTLEANNMTLDDIEVVETESAIEAAELFMDREVVACVTWSPFDAQCIDEINGSKVLTSTKDATHIIADIFFAKGVWVEENSEMLKQIIEGWMIGNAEINTSASAKNEAISILANGLDDTEDNCKAAINNVRLATFGDNLNFFKLNGDYKGVDGEDVYKSMGRIYSKLGSAPSSLPKWRNITNRDAFREITLRGSKHKAEPAFVFEVNTNDTKKTAFASKDVTINFPSGSSVLSATEQGTIDKDVAGIIQTFGGVKVRVEGNTDSQGGRALNTSLSKKRAQAVVDYLVTSYGIPSNKFIVVGNGPDKPVANNNTSAGRALNRRTEIKFIK